MTEELQDAWVAAGAKASSGVELTMLPSGAEVQLDLPSIELLMASGALPTALRGIALGFASGEGLALDELEEEEQGRATELQRFMIRTSVIGLKLPGRELVSPYRIPDGDLESDPPRIPRDDLIALRDMVWRIRTPAQIDAISRLAHLKLSRDDAEDAGASAAELKALDEAIDERATAAAKVVERERRGTLEGWASFRRFAGRPARGPDGGDVRRPPVGPADHLGPGGRLRPRRGARPAARPRSARAARSDG